MKEKTFKDISSAIRTTFKRAQGVVKSGDIEYSIVILKDIVKNAPEFTDARNLLREQEQTKTENMGTIGKLIASVKSGLKLSKGKILLNKKPLETMKIAEDILALYLNYPPGLNLLADAAMKADANFIAIEALEICREYAPDNDNNLRKLANVYKKSNNGRMYMEVMQTLAKKHPGDLTIQGEVRAAAAMATMNKDMWEEDGSSQDKLAAQADADGEKKQGEKIVRNIDDVKEHIQNYEQEIEEGSESTDLRRKLAELYVRAERFEDSVKSYEWIANKMGTLDPAIDSAIEKSQIAIIDRTLKELESQTGKESEVEKLKKERFAYRLERATSRVKSYPSDTELRYCLGEILFEKNDIEDALAQFQISRKNPQRKLSSFIYLGRCFHLQNQNDLAEDQFNNAINGMPIMDKAKMEALYYFGTFNEAIGKIDEAKKCYKDIYGADIKYRDVSKKLKNLT